jgi:hypothetical protein
MPMPEVPNVFELAARVLIAIFRYFAAPDVGHVARQVNLRPVLRLQAFSTAHWTHSFCALQPLLAQQMGTTFPFSYQSRWTLVKYNAESVAPMGSLSAEAASASRPPDSRVQPLTIRVVSSTANERDPCKEVGLITAEPSPTCKRSSK